MNSFKLSLFLMFLGIGIMLGAKDQSNNSSRGAVVVKTSAELQALLTKDEDLGTVLLDADEFELEDVIVKAGGVIKPYPGRKPIIVGRHISSVQDGMKVEGYDGGDFYLLDGQNNALSASNTNTIATGGHITITAANVAKLDDKTFKVRIELPDCKSQLLNKSREYLKNCTLKCSYWFLCFDIKNLYSDDKYIYGNANNSGSYETFVAYAPRPDATLAFFNIPADHNGVYIDSEDIIHNIPNDRGRVGLYYSKRIFTLTGPRNLKLEGLTFCGSREPVALAYRNSSNKTVQDCSFHHCGNGISCDNGIVNVDANVTVKNCDFREMYGNTCILLEGCDRVTVTGNKTYHTGLLNKGFPVISVSGDNFNVSDNEIRAFSYIGIRVGNTRDPSAEKISGKVSQNYIDNAEYFVNGDVCLSDGGGIYVYTHNDDTEILYNIVCNNGFKNGWERGIFLDDGAYNVKLIGNLIYNIYEETIHARYVPSIELSCINNEFRDNILLGDCKMFGNSEGKGKKALISGNYVQGKIITDPEFSISRNNVTIRAQVIDGKPYIDKRAKLNKSKYPKFILRHLNAKKTL
jgi:hypothetical protein